MFEEGLAQAHPHATACRMEELVSGTDVGHSQGLLLRLALGRRRRFGRTGGAHLEE